MNIKKIKLLPLYIIILTLFSSFWGIGKDLDKKTLKYNEEKDGKIKVSTWEIVTKDKKITITGNEENATYFMEFKEKPYELEKYSCKTKDDKADYTFQRNGKILKISGKADGNEISKEYDIGNSKWFQNFGFCLKPFVDSNDKSIKFIIINPKDFSKIDMIAEKEENEKLKIKNKEFDSIKIKITLTGFKSMFWHGDIWFDSKTKEYLKYQANEGPHTAETTITLDIK